MADADRAGKLDEYKTVVEQFKALTEIRFKLLALLPLGTISALAVLKSEDRVFLVAAGTFGVVVTLALFVYSLRKRPALRRPRHAGRGD